MCSTIVIAFRIGSCHSKSAHFAKAKIAHSKQPIHIPKRLRRIGLDYECNTFLHLAIAGNRVIAGQKLFSKAIAILSRSDLGIPIFAASADQSVTAFETS